MLYRQDRWDATVQVIGRMDEELSTVAAQFVENSRGDLMDSVKGGNGRF